MFGTYFQESYGAPPDIVRFEQLWLSTLALTAIITIMVFDCRWAESGPTVLRYSPARALADLFC